MARTAQLGAQTFPMPPSHLLRRLGLGAACLLAILATVILLGRWFGHSIAMGGHTDDTTVHEIVIGDDMIAAPANMIRFDHARRDGVTERLDLYMRWPAMDGYSKAHADDFNNLGPERRLIFASFEPRIMSRDMTGRLAPIYKALVVQPGAPGPGGSTVYQFDPKSGYANEELVVFERRNDPPFVARCLTGQAARDSLAPCQRDVDVGRKLSLSYRFPLHLLERWPELDKAMRDRTAHLLRTRP